jgi:hypothetical protein
VAVMMVSRADRVRRVSPAADSVSSIERFFVRGVFPANAFAQTPPAAPGAPPVVGIDGAALSARRYEYRIQYVDTSGRVTPDGDGVVSLTEAQYNGVPSWLVTHVARMTASSGQQRATAETLHVTRKDLRLLSRAVHESPYRRYSQITIRQRFVGDSVVGEMSTDGGVRRPIARQLPMAFGPYISDALAPLGLVGVGLSPDWRGSLSIIGWAVVPNDLFYPVTLRVVGEEKLSTSHGSRRLLESSHLRPAGAAHRMGQEIRWCRVAIARRSAADSKGSPRVCSPQSVRVMDSRLLFRSDRRRRL